MGSSIPLILACFCCSEVPDLKESRASRPSYRCARLYPLSVMCCRPVVCLRWQEGLLSIGPGERDAVGQTASATMHLTVARSTQNRFCHTASRYMTANDRFPITRRGLIIHACVVGAPVSPIRRGCGGSPRGASGVPHARHASVQPAITVVTRPGW